MATYIGQNLTQGSRQRVSYTATANQTTFSAGYAPGFVDVYQNGLLLPTSEYTASDGSTVVLNTGAALNDEIEIIGQFLFAVEDTVSSSSGGTFNNTVNVLGDFTVQDNFTVDTNTLYVDATNNRVGIGTTTPNFLMDLEGASNSTYLRVGGDDINNDRGLRFTSSASASFNGAIHTINAPSSQGEIAFATNSSEAMRIDENGNVGIGTSSPQAQLDVKNGTTYSASGDFLARIQQNFNSTGKNGLSVMIAGNPAGTNNFIFEAAVGWNGTATGYYPVFTIDGTGQTIFSNGGPQQTTPVERMRIANNGYVGIGTSSPDTYLHVDDKDGIGPTVIIEGGGTNQNTPADGEQTLFLKTGDGTGDLSTGIGFFATFENTPADTNDRRATDIRAGFDGGAWGNEYMSFHVGKGTGTTDNDAAAMTDERLRITKTAVIANVDIEDSISNVRTPRRIAISTTGQTISNEGVYYLTPPASSNIILGAPVSGTVMTLYNNTGNTISLEDGNTVTHLRLAADNNTTHNNTLTLGAYSTTTITMFSGIHAIVTGTDVSAP